MKRIKLGHHYYYVVTPDDLSTRKFRGKNIVLEGVVEDKPLVEFLPMELPAGGQRSRSMGSPSSSREVHALEKGTP